MVPNPNSCLIVCIGEGDGSATCAFKPGRKVKAKKMRNSLFINVILHNYYDIGSCLKKFVWIKRAGEKAVFFIQNTLLPFDKKAGYSGIDVAPDFVFLKNPVSQKGRRHFPY